MKICDSVGLSELCNGCGAAMPHSGDYCEPCPAVSTAKCNSIELVAAKTPGFSLINRGIRETRYGTSILPFNPYDFYKTDEGQYFALNS